MSGFIGAIDETIRMARSARIPLRRGRLSRFQVWVVVLLAAFMGLIWYAYAAQVARDRLCATAETTIDPDLRARILATRDCIRPAP